MTPRGGSSGRIGADKALYYESLADYFSSRNPANALVSAGGAGLSYILVDAPSQAPAGSIFPSNFLTPLVDIANAVGL